MDQSQLAKEATECARKIRSAELFEEPFKHLIIDDFLSDDLAQSALNSFPPLSEKGWEHTKEVGIEVKSRSNWQSEFDIPENIIDVVRIANSALILKAMSSVLQIPKLMPDPYFSGGGLNASQTNGHLDVHVDGNYHDVSGLNRRVNLLIYLNPNWIKSWGGEFGIYSEDATQLVKAVPPLFNRCVIFDSHDKSYHGLPNPIKFPEEDPRRSIIMYYYTAAPRPNDQITIKDPHSALWRSKGFVDKKGNKERDFY